MPTLVQDASATNRELNVADSSSATNSKTPKRSNSAKKTKSKVTPESETSAQRKDGRSTKKQATLMSFFGAASMKSPPFARSNASTKNPTCRSTKTDPQHDASTATFSSERTPNTSSPINMLMVSSSQPNTDGVDKESLREIVLGSVLPQHLKQTPILVDYERHKGSPMPTNLSVPTLRSSRERLIDRLNSTEAAVPRRLLLTQTIQPATSKDPSMTILTQEQGQLTGNEVRQCNTDFDILLSTKTTLDAETNASASGDGNNKENDARCFEGNEDEKTVCFSQPGETDDDLMMQTDLEHTVKGDGYDEDVMMQTESVEETSKGNIIIVDMTQVRNDYCFSDNGKGDSADEDDEDMSIEAIPETLVDMTQVDSKGVPALNQTDAESNLDSIEFSAIKSNKNPGKQSTPAVMIDLRHEAELEGTAGDGERVVVKAFTEVNKNDGAATKLITKKTTSSQSVEPIPMTVCPERLEQLKEIEKARAKAERRLSTVRERIAEGLEEENFTMPNSSAIQADEFGEELSQQAVIKLAVIVQDSDLPLSAISRKALDQLKTDFKGISLETVSDRIKTYFTRENYIFCSAAELKALDKLEDVSNRMWRWELISLELLPEDMASKVKKAQTARRKIRNHSKAFVSLLRALDDAEKTLSDPLCKKEQCEKIMSKVDSLQENVLKYERSAEKARLLQEAKKRKEKEKLELLLQKQKEKEAENATKKEELERKKEEASKKKEKAKLKKKQEEEKKKQEEEEAKKAALKKNKAFMLSFFGTKPAKALEPMVAIVQPALISSDESATFWEQINSSDAHTGNLFDKPSTRGIPSRRRRTRKVAVPVYVTTSVPTNGFNDERVYAELKTVYFPNKYKFLSFFENHRPPYHGTWSKRSKIISGKNPFGQDKEQLDYDEDSEAEWEEGDDEFGEDLQDEAADDEEENMDPEEGDTRAYNFQDGWLAEDDDVVYENEEIDEETKILRKIAKSAEMELREAIVAPYTGGLPLVDNVTGEGNIDLTDFVYVNGEGQNDRMQPLKLGLLTSEAVILCHEDVCLDAYPPNIIDENFVGDPSAIASTGNTQKSMTNQEMSDEDMKVFAEFVHHSTFPSKDRLIEELRTTHPTVTASRAQATRKLDVVATKRKNPMGGVIWEVKRQVLEELGLAKQLSMTVPDREPKKEEPKKVKVQKLQPKKKITKAGEALVETSELSDSAKSEKTALRKKRKKPVVDEAAAALFAQFLTKKAKSSLNVIN